MPVLKNRTQNDFTMISNKVLRDKELSMKDRGVLCTIYSLPEGWDFSIAGLSAIVPDGIDSIRAAVLKLEQMGYMVRTKTRAKNGKYLSEIEVFNERQTIGGKPSRENHNGLSEVEKPSRSILEGSTNTDKTTEYNNDNIINTSNIDKSKSITQSGKEMDDGDLIERVREEIADNIELDSLFEIANRRGSKEVEMVTEVYDVICDMVCFKRDKVYIKGVEYPWETVKNQFFKLRYSHVANILNRIVDAELGIKNISSYLISTLYTESLVGIIEEQSEIHDDYMKILRGKPY